MAGSLHIRGIKTVQNGLPSLADLQAFCRWGTVFIAFPGKAFNTAMISVDCLTRQKNHPKQINKDFTLLISIKHFVCRDTEQWLVTLSPFFDFAEFNI